MRNILALIVGIAISILLFLIIIYTFAYLDVGPSKQLLSVNFDYYSLRKIFKFIIFVIFPIVFFISGFIETFIAKSNEYLIGFLSTIPILVISFNKTIYFFLAIVVVILSMLIGVKLSKKLKNGKRPLSGLTRLPEMSAKGVGPH